MRGMRRGREEREGMRVEERGGRRERKGREEREGMRGMMERGRGGRRGEGRERRGTGERRGKGGGREGGDGLICRCMLIALFCVVFVVIVIVGF